MRTVRTILAVMLTVVCCTQLAAQGFSREQFPEGSYSPVTNINPNGYPRVLADNSVMFRVSAPQAQLVQIRQLAENARAGIRQTAVDICFHI